jgi:hypothetical protein
MLCYQIEALIYNMLCERNITIFQRCFNVGNMWVAQLAALGLRFENLNIRRFDQCLLCASGFDIATDQRN